MLVLARVPASTCFTMTAQYRLQRPSVDGSDPDTTTDPGGTRRVLSIAEIRGARDNTLEVTALYRYDHGFKADVRASFLGAS